MITELFQLFMRVNYGDYFLSLGFKDVYYDPYKNTFNEQAIFKRITAIQDKWRTKYHRADFRLQNLLFDNIVLFNQSFTEQIEFLNMDA